VSCWISRGRASRPDNSFIESFNGKFQKRMSGFKDACDGANPCRHRVRWGAVVDTLQQTGLAALGPVFLIGEHRE
jgi:hypothetical protein